MINIQRFGGRGASSSLEKQINEALSVRTNLQNKIYDIDWVNDDTKVVFYDKSGYEELKSTKISKINAPSNNEFLNMRSDSISAYKDDNEIKIYTKTESKKSSTGGKYNLDYWKKRGIEIKNSVPKGWIKLEGSTTAPNGYSWYSNGKSRFGGEYKHMLVKDKKKK